VSALYPTTRVRFRPSDDAIRRELNRLCVGARGHQQIGARRQLNSADKISLERGSPDPRSNPILILCTLTMQTSAPASIAQVGNPS